MKILALIGSLRDAAFSRKLARAAALVAPAGMALEENDCGDLPLYNQDLDGETKPPGVARLLEQVNEANGILFVTPEFNYGIPGPLKNAIDWASRPAYRSPLMGKPSLVVSHSIAPSGGARAHAQLCSVLVGTLTPVYLAPSFVIPAIHEKFDEAGQLTDEPTKARLAQTLDAFATWCSRTQP